MKTLLLTITTLLILTAPALSQEHNPDGTGPSIHFNPYVSWGTYEDKTIGHNFDYELKFNFTFAIKYPVNNFFTLSAFYGNRSFQLRPQDSTGLINYDVAALGQTNNAGITFSFYIH